MNRMERNAVASLDLAFIAGNRLTMGELSLDIKFHSAED